MVWPKDPPQSDAQPPSLCKASRGPLARLRANYSSARPSSVGQPPARSANLDVTTAGPGVPLLLQKLSSLDVGNERRFVSADADNRRYHQKDHSAPQTTAPPSSGTSFSALGARVYWFVVLCDL
ncbi:hypothetical protein E4U52_003531 [Claviceps spartinae]|nr:hypothetical protein E4U52_003531 [Claviceps spartinae]